MKRLLLLFPLLAFAAGASADTTDELRKYALKLINRERTRLNFPGVKLDAEVTKYAQERAREVLAGKEDGLTPYMRWSFRGREDRVAENVAGWSISYSPTEHALRELVRQSHETMMAEQPPLHGRRAAIVDPYATHVGIGIVWEGGQFRIVENFVRRYVGFHAPLPRRAAPTDTVLVMGRPKGQAIFDSITVHHEPFPDAASKLGDALPASRKEYLPKLGSSVKKRENSNRMDYERYQYSENRFGEVDVTKEGDFSFAVPFTEGPGIYTIAVWVTTPDSIRPFAATNVSIRVEESAVVNMLSAR